jgi:hypothetical protein
LEQAGGADGRARWLAAGAVFGVVAGVFFALFEMVVAWQMGDGFWMPLRMIGAILIGADALEPTYSLAGAAIAGAVLHMTLSTLYRAVFAGIAAVGGLLSRPVLVAAATVYGLALWLVNFYVIALFAFEWFQDADPLVQFLAHTFVYGSLLGLLLAAVRPAVREARFDELAAQEPLAHERGLEPAELERSPVRERTRTRA